MGMRESSASSLKPTYNVPEYIRKLVPYVPGKPIEETQREFKIKRVIKLASNENPLGPSPKAVKAMSGALPDLHRYPDAAAYALKQALAKHLDVEMASLIVGNGSNEIIDFLIRTYCLPGDAIATSQAAFIAYKICAQIHGVRTLEAPLTPDLCFDLTEILDRVRADSRARMVFIANPNNPTGTYVTSAELEGFLSQLQTIRGGSVIAVLDYAYWEYVTAKDLSDPMELLKKFPNVVILRTFSKIYGLAGIRVGYGIADPAIIANLEKVRQPFNLNSQGLVGAVAALKDRAFVERSRKLNQRGMRFWEKNLRKMGIPFWPSQGNFLLIDAQEGARQAGRVLTGGELYSASLRMGVIFRPLTNYGLPRTLRVTIGTDEENRIAVKILREVLGPGVPGVSGA